MAIDMASFYAVKYRKTPDVLRAAVMGQSPDKSLDSYTALNALKLVSEADMTAMAGKAQQPTSAPSFVAQALTPPAPPQGLGAMIPMGAPAGQMPQQRAPAPQPVMQAASGGLAGMYTPEEDFAEGGIVAFSEPTPENNYSLVRTEYGDSNRFSPFAKGSDDVDTDTDANTDVGTGDATKQFNAMLMRQIAKMQGRGARTTSPEDIKRLRAEFLAKEIKNAGPDIYEAEIERGAQEDADRGKRRNTGEAMALLTAAGKVLKGRNLAEGASEALPAYAGAMGEVDRADQAIKSANAKMQFALKDAQRKERAGNNRAADAAMENYRKFQQDENKAEFDRDNAVANLAAKGITGNRARAGAGAGGLKLAEQLGAAEIAYARNPTKENLIDVQALRKAVSQTKTSFSTGEIGSLRADMAALPVQANIDSKVNEALQRFKTTDTAGSPYRAALRKKNMDEANRLLQAEESRLRGVFERSEAGSRAPAAAPKPKVIKLD